MLKNLSPFLSVREVVTLTSLPRSTVIKHSKTGQFPAQVRLCGNRIAFVRADVQNWIDSRVTSAKGVA
jgi:prophage regulatory protein